MPALDRVRHRASRRWAWWCVLATAGCGEPRNAAPWFASSGANDTSTGAIADGTSGDTGAATAWDPDGHGDTHAPPKLDVAGAGGGEGGVGLGCTKVDFLFVVDDSGSMQDEQDHLAAAFPEFLATIQATLQAHDYHLMVVDTDGMPDGGNCNGAPASCCASVCAFDPTKLCGGMVCPGVDACSAALGAGRTEDGATNDCGVAGDARYLLDSQPQLDQTFACVARVGVHGDGNERQIAAITEAIGPLAADGQCNAGFLRDDAILVVTLITDEEDDPSDAGDPDPGSPGDPQAWYEALVAAKGGNAEAIVVLGLVGDTDVPGGICPPLVDVIGAEPAPRLRAFVEQFGPRGSWASVCAPDYGPFFAQAVASIDLACDEFEPEG